MRSRALDLVSAHAVDVNRLRGAGEVEAVGLADGVAGVQDVAGAAVVVDNDRRSVERGNHRSVAPTTPSSAIPSQPPLAAAPLSVVPALACAYAKSILLWGQTPCLISSTLCSCQFIYTPCT